MASSDIENKSENLTTSDNQQTSSTKSVPIYNASSSHEHSHSCNDPSHHHDYPLFFDQNNDQLADIAAKNEMLMKRKAKKNQKQGITRAELIPGHQGDRNIDDLVNFINGPSSANNKAGDKKSKKKLATNN